MRRRESLLAAHPLATTSSPTPQADPSASEVPSASAQDAVTNIPTQAVSRSQQIASSVVSGTTVELSSPSTPGAGSPGQLSPEMTKLLAALSAGQGGSGSPVHVIIKERESQRVSLS